MQNLSDPNPDAIRSQVPDESHTSGGEGEANATPNIIRTVETDGHIVMEDASSEEALNDADEGSTHEKLTRELRQVESELPDTLREITTLFPQAHEKLMVLYGLVSSIGCVAPLSHVAYADRKNYPCLMSLMLMPPASGKGVISLVRKLYSKIDAQLLAQSTFKNDLYLMRMREFKKRTRAGEQVELPERPPFDLLCVPGNTTSAMLIQLLSDTKGKQSLLQIETESSILSTVGKSEHFRLLNSLFRQIYHHEVISQARKTNHEILTCENPKLNVILTGTPSQAVGLLRSASDGLVSRFLVLYSTPPAQWKDVSPGETNLDDQFNLFAEKIHAIWEAMRYRDIEMLLTEKQWEQINAFGGDQLPKVSGFLGDDAASLPKRHANMAVRIALVLTIIRMYDESTELEKTYCKDSDFQIALWIMRHSFDSAIRLYKELPGSDSVVEEGTKLYLFYQKLPISFSFTEIKPFFHEMKISDRTVNRYIFKLMSAGLLIKVGKGLYQKPISKSKVGVGCDITSYRHPLF